METQFQDAFGKEVKIDDMVVLTSSQGTGKPELQLGRVMGFELQRKKVWKYKPGGNSGHEWTVHRKLHIRLGKGRGLTHIKNTDRICKVDNLSPEIMSTFELN